MSQSLNKISRSLEGGLVPGQGPRGFEMKEELVTWGGETVLCAAASCQGKFFDTAQQEGLHAVVTVNVLYD